MCISTGSCFGVLNHSQRDPGVEIRDMLRESKFGFSQICWGRIFGFLYINNQCIAQFLQESIWILAKSPEGESLREWILKFSPNF